MVTNSGEEEPLLRKFNREIKPGLQSTAKHLADLNTKHLTTTSAFYELVKVSRRKGDAKWMDKWYYGSWIQFLS
jgi:hypothetical protein